MRLYDWAIGEVARIVFRKGGRPPASPPPANTARPLPPSPSIVAGDVADRFTLNVDPNAKKGRLLDCRRCGPSSHMRGDLRPDRTTARRAVLGATMSALAPNRPPRLLGNRTRYGSTPRALARSLPGAARTESQCAIIQLFDPTDMQLRADSDPCR